MIKFVDNSYLHAVGACLDGKATHINQVKTFLRFIGEVIVSEEVLFTADIKGPVYPITEKVIEQIYLISGGVSLINYHQLGLSRYNDACDSAAVVLTEEIEYLNTLPQTGIGDFNPVFQDKNNPHDRLHRLITNKNISKKRKLSLRNAFSSPISSNIAAFIMLREPVYSKIDGLIQQQVWTSDLTHSIAVAARMLVYEKIAEDIDAIYLPSTGRIFNHVVNFKPRDTNFLLLTDHADKDSLRPDEFRGLVDLVDSLIIISNGDPKKLLKEAFLIRKNSEHLRKSFCSMERKFKGDAYLINAKRLLKQYQDILEFLMKGEQPPSFIMSITPQIVFPGIPVLKLDVLKLGLWASFKSKLGHVKSIANVFFKAEEARKREIYEKFLIRCMGKSSV